MLSDKLEERAVVIGMLNDHAGGGSEHVRGCIVLVRGKRYDRVLEQATVRGILCRAKYGSRSPAEGQGLNNVEDANHAECP